MPTLSGSTGSNSHQPTAVLRAEMKTVISATVRMARTPPRWRENSSMLVGALVRPSSLKSAT